jgi:hypothetical protein
LQDYHFDDDLVLDRITVPSFEFESNTDAKRNIDNFLDSFIQEEADTLPELVPPQGCDQLQQQDDAVHIVCNLIYWKNYWLMVSN